MFENIEITVELIRVSQSLKSWEENISAQI